MNRVEISGKLTRDPEVRYLGDTRFPVASMNVAVDNGSGRWNRETRKNEYESGFYQVEVVGRYGESLVNQLSRGDEVYVVGSLSQFTRQGKDGGESTSHTRIKGVMVIPLTGVGMAGGGIAPPSAPLVDDDPWRPPAGDAGGF